MNYYRRYSGDYLRKTARLNLTEHGAYCVLMDYYYTDERPLPLDRDELYMMVRAMRPEDRKAVDKVLALFFTKEPDGYHQKRCDEEIAVSKKARANGKKGGRPPAEDKTETITEPETEEETEPETQTITGSGHPLTANHYPPSADRQPPASNRQPPPKSALPPPPVDNPSRAGVVAATLRAAGVKVTAQHPLLLAWVNELQATDEQLAEALERARLNKPKPEPIPAAYLDPVLREVCNPKPRKANGNGNGHGAWWASEASITAKGHELGLSARGGETWDQFRGRISEEIERRKRA